MNLRREAIASSDYWEFQPGERVMTVDGYPGVIDLVEDGPIAGAENYVVTLDKGLGGGNYSASMLTKMPTARSAAGIHLATDDYPELGSVIDDRPDPGKMTFTAARVVPNTERADADAEDHDEEDPEAIDPSLPGGSDDQPHSCSYCGSTDFKDFADNGRVRQATCATCGGTMSAHPGMQWTPELIGDPSNHPKAIIDPRSGASPGAGAPGQAGINDFTDYNSRVSTTAAMAAEHGISHVYRGVHGPAAASAAEANRAGDMGSGMYGRGFYTTSSPDLATGYAQAHSGDRTGVFMHGQIHPDASVGHLDDVPKHVQHGTETDWAREHGHDVLTDGVHTHIVTNPHAITWDPKNYDIGEARKKFNRWGEDYDPSPPDLHHTAATDGPDWCTWRRTARCTFPGDITTDGHVLGIPQDRGPCPWKTRWQQQVCPISEPGPGAGMERKGSTVAARDFVFEHQEQQTGGTKFPVQHTLHARDADSNESGGHVEYFPPKRKGGPVHIDNLNPSLNTPGSGSALLNEVQNRHPDSTMKFLHETKRDQNTPGHTNSSHGEPTDWDTWHAGVQDGIHRGFALRVEPHHAQVLNDPSRSRQEHLQALHEAMPEGHKMGMHWTTEGERAKSFAQTGVMDPRRDIPVVLHAKGPARKDIETRPDQLFRNGVFPYDHVSKEREVPIRRGRKVEVTGMSWKPDAEHPDADRNGWVHHTYGEDETKRHTASVNTTMLAIAGVPTLPDRVGSSATTAALEARMASDDEDDYRMQHQAPDADYGAPLHDVSAMMPDFYEHPEYYHAGQEHFHDSASVIRAARDQPEKMIHIYRALPGEHAHKGIRPGDWVSTSKDYARGEGRMSDPKDDYPVIRARVPAKHLHTEGDVHEWGYNGPDTVHGMVVYKGGHNQEVRHNAEGLIKQVQRRPRKEAAETTSAMNRLAERMAKILGPGSANR